MKAVKGIKWIPVLFLMPALLAGCVASGDETMPDSLVQTGSEQQPDIISWFTADISYDGKEELLLITKDSSDGAMSLDSGEPYGRYIDIYSEYDIQNNIPKPQGEPLYRFDLTDIKPLYIQAGDIDGDGTVEIAVCVYKTAEFHPVPAKRPFFYDLQDGQLEPVWLGSRLSRPFADYILFDVDRDDIAEIISIEYTENGNKVLAVYDWKGFGFEVKTQTGEIEDTVTFLKHTNDRSDMILVEIGGESHQLCLDEGEVIRCIKEH